MEKKIKDESGIHITEYNEKNAMRQDWSGLEVH